MKQYKFEQSGSGWLFFFYINMKIVLKYFNNVSPSIYSIISPSSYSIKGRSENYVCLKYKYRLTCVDVSRPKDMSLQVPSFNKLEQQ